MRFEEEQSLQSKEDTREESLARIFDVAPCIKKLGDQIRRRKYDPSRRVAKGVEVDVRILEHLL